MVAKAKTEKHAGGRPTKYAAAKHNDLVEAHAASTKTDAEIAACLKVSWATLKTWLKKHPEFLAAHKRGRAQLLDGVEAGLYRKASGYEYVEVDVTIEEFISCKPMSVKEKAYRDAIAAREEGEHTYQIKRTTKHRHAAPDTGAAALVLCNRRKPGYDEENPDEGWQHVNRVEVSGPDGGPISHSDAGPDLTRLSPEELAAYEQALKILATEPRD